MTLDPSADSVFCQNCGARWSDSLDTTMHYFATSPEFAAKTSSSELIALGVEILHCPKCPLPRLDEAMMEGDDRRSG